MYTPKSILVHLDSSVRTALRVKVARVVADDFDAQVTGLFDATPSLLRYPLATEYGTVAIDVLMELDDDCRKAAHKAFIAASAGSERLKWLAYRSGPLQGFADRALYADLLILGQRDAEDPAAGELPDDFVPRTLVESGKPVLMIPYVGSMETIGMTVLIAWKATREAARAVTAALPWLRRAQTVHVICYDAAPAAPLEWLRDYLTIQNVAVTLHRGGSDQGTPGELLLSQAADLRADLLVMGGYGHSRAREWVLGGATRSVLQAMTLPVLMVH